MRCRPFLSVLVLVIINFNLATRHGVAAGAHELVPFGASSWIRSVEKEQQVEEPVNYVPANEIYAEFANMTPRKRKTKEAMITRKAEDNFEKSRVSKKRKKKKRRKKKKPIPNPRRFVKMTTKDKDKDSNMTDSIEVTGRSKPVDIIVHIKMTE